MSNVIRQYLESQQYNTVPDETYSHIDEWLEWYQNDVKKFHHYKVYNGAVTTEQERFRLGMAKTICEDWANLLLNEKVSIKAGDYSTRLEEVLASNKFRVNGNRLIELAFALGTGAFVEYMGGDDEIIIDYIRADMIYPLSWDNGEITECAFGSTRVVDGKERVYLQIHRFGNPEEGETADSYYLENKYLDAESGKEIEPPEDIIPLINTGSRIPLFQILTPNIYNNIDMDSPLGVSVFSNAMKKKPRRSWRGLQEIIRLMWIMSIGQMWRVKMNQNRNIVKKMKKPPKKRKTVGILIKRFLGKIKRRWFKC